MTENYVHNIYIIKRQADLRKTSNLNELAEKVASLEMALMDLANTVLDKEFPEMTAIKLGESLLTVDLTALYCLDRIDQENHFNNLWAYLEEEN